MKKILFRLFIFTAFFTFTFADNINVKLVSPAPEDNHFWGSTISFAQLVAKSLDINLKVIYSNDRIDYMNKLNKTIDESNNSDYLIYMFRAGVSYETLKKAEDKGVYSFIINSEPLKEYSSDINENEDKLKHWVSHIVPDDKNAGKNLIKYLANFARSNKLYADDGKIHISALSGSYDSSPALERNKGLIDYIEKNNDLVLDRLVFTGWFESRAYYKAKIILKSFPDTAIFWCANDDIALGAITATKETHKKPNKDIFIAGIDWSPTAIKSISNNDIKFSLGQHFTEAGVSLLKIYDHYHGLNIGDKKNLSKLIYLGRENAYYYFKLKDKAVEQSFDLKKFTKYHNSSIENYDFSVLNFIRDLNLD